MNTDVSLGLLSRWSQVRVLPRVLGENMRRAANACKRKGSDRSTKPIEHATSGDDLHTRQTSWSHSGRIEIPRSLPSDLRLVEAEPQKISSLDGSLTVYISPAKRWKRPKVWVDLTTPRMTDETFWCALRVLRRR